VLVGLSARRQDMVQQLQDMQSRLLGVAKDLEVAIEDPSSAPEQPAATSEITGDDDPVDSLEGMLSDEDVDLPEIPSLELDFDDDDQA